jgi:outer membrane lipase/esterase
MNPLSCSAMTFPSLLRVTTLVSLSLLASCGGGSIDSQFTPERVLAVGDGFADLGQDGARYTINDGTVNNWTLTLAQTYGATLAASTTGGLSLATGQARVSTHPVAAGSAARPTVSEQATTLLASVTPQSTDLVILAAGTGDVIAEAQAYFSGAQSEAQMLANLSTAGTALGAQVRRFVAAGASHVLVVGPYNLGISAWAQQLDQASALELASNRFNESLLLSIVDLGDTVLYVDAAYYFNLLAASPSTYGLSNVSEPACTSVDSGAGIGTGTGQVNSNLCTADTLATGIDPAVYLFADRVYPTPVVQRLFGAYAYERLHDRW